MAMDLQAKLGPFPVWVWGAVIGVGVVVWVWVSSADSSADGSETVAETVTPTIADSSLLDRAFAGGMAPGYGGAPASVETPIETNTTWASSLLPTLSGKGFAPLDVQLALARYLNADGLSAEQQKMVNLALTLKGAPPDGVYGGLPNAGTETLKPAPKPAPKPVTPVPKPVVVTPKPAPKPAAKPVSQAITIARGDTLAKLAKRYNTTVSALAKLNGIRNVNRIYAGAKLRVK